MSDRIKLERGDFVVVNFTGTVLSVSGAKVTVKSDSGHNAYTLPIEAVTLDCDDDWYAAEKAKREKGGGK